MSVRGRQKNPARESLFGVTRLADSNREGRNFLFTPQTNDRLL